jgi:hypothetical protein
MNDIYSSVEMKAALRMRAIEVLSKSSMTQEQIVEVVKKLYQADHEDYTEEWIVKEIGELRKSTTKRHIQMEVEEFVTQVTFQGGDVTLSSQDVTRELGLNTKEERAAGRKAIQRLVEKGVLESVRNKSGLYRRIDGVLKKIDFTDTSDLIGELPIVFPLGVEAWIKPMPGTIGVIAGEVDAGKSALCMQFAKMNYTKIPVHYYSSEMGKAEFLDRLQYFWTDAGMVAGMNFYERSEAFQDAVKQNPNHIHIIDYLNLFDNFYLMAEEISKIEESLKNGFALIALQKPSGRDSGLGGERTKNLPRLYLSMSPGRLKITKAKNWRNPKSNPNGMCIRYKLIDGCKFINETSWQREDK